MRKHGPHNLSISMKLCRYKTRSEDAPRFGFIEGAEVFPLANNEIFSVPFAPPETGPALLLADVTLLAPVTPSKIVCVGRNYKEHAAELGNAMPDEPLLFLKAPSALIGPEDLIELPPASARVEHEGELAVVIGRQTRQLTATDNPLDYVLGYTCVNDVTARDLQRKDVQFTRAKSFDTFCPVGPHIETDLDPLDVQVTTRVNGTIKQQARTSAMAFPVPFLIHYISHIMTLQPGDLISTGTPAGVGPLTDGDTCEVEVEGVGVLRNTVRAAHSS
jgi:2-keto-4-pentenoate hydratase/2-oxohepta-3-ene-1,7-dioic acid hydratase in catechol pathway